MYLPLTLIASPRDFNCLSRSMELRARLYFVYFAAGSRAATRAVRVQWIRSTDVASPVW